MPFTPVFGSKFVVRGEERQYDVTPRPTPVEKPPSQQTLNIVVLGNRESKTIRQHLGIKEASTPRDEVVRAQKTTSSSKIKTSQYKQDLLTSQES